MKKLIAYFLLSVVLILGTTTMSVYAIQANFSVEKTTNNTDGQTPSDDDYFFTALTTPINSCALSRVNSAQRIQTVEKKEIIDFHWLQTSYFSQLAYQQFYANKSTHSSFYAQKQLSGYYIYALRKLLI